MPEQPVDLQRHDWLAALGLAVLVLLAGSWRMAPGVCGAYHDDGIYVSTAEALATGQGYRLIDVPGSPLQTKYPVLYPAFIATIWWSWPSFPANLVALQAATLMFAGAAVAAAYLYLVRFAYFTRRVAFGGCVLCATAPFFLYFGVQTMAEMPFALLSIAACWGLELALIRTNLSRRSQFGVGMLLALPFLCRTIGATIIVGGIWALWRSGRSIRYCASGAALAALPWVCWSLAGRGIWDQDPVDGYYTDYLGCWSSTGVRLASKVFLFNLLMTAQGSAELTLEGLWAAMEPWIGRKPLFAVFMLIGLTPWMAMAPGLRRGRVLPCVMAAYLAAVLVWSWPPYRFLVPILPFVAAYLLAVSTNLLRACGQGPVRQLAGAVGVGILIVANGGLLARHVLHVREHGYPLADIHDTTVAWSSHKRIFSWLEKHSRPHDVICSGLDSMVALYTNRQAIRPIVYNPGRIYYGEKTNVLETAEELAQILIRHRPRYLIENPLPGFAEEKLFADALDELRCRHPAWLRMVYQDADPRFVIFELDPNHEPQSKRCQTPPQGAVPCRSANGASMGISTADGPGG